MPVEMKAFTVDCGAGLPVIRFTGSMIGFVESDDQLTTLILYRTQGGKYVCEKIEHPKREWQTYKSKGKVCKDEACIFKFFGNGALAKKLFAFAKLEKPIVDVD